MNMMKYCPECYKELPPNSAVCPYCGYRTSTIDDGEEVFVDVLDTPQVDSYIPPEQTFLGVMLLFIIFWGINIAGTAMPIFLDIGTKRNILIAAILSQVITRLLIGAWAVEEVSLKRGANLKNKIGTFLLALVPIGDIIAALNAARTSIRKERLTMLSISGIASVLVMSLVIFQTSDQIKSFIKGGEQNSLPEVSSTQVVTEELVEGDTPTPPPTATYQAFFNGCKNPLTLTDSDEGKTVVVCGKITNYGTKDCVSCPHGFYSFVKLENKFQIVSYEWKFTHAFLGKCVMIEDEVQLIGDIPNFVFNMGEGCIGNCIHDFHGGLIDDNGEYFQPFNGCD